MLTLGIQEGTPHLCIHMPMQACISVCVYIYVHGYAYEHMAARRNQGTFRFTQKEQFVKQLVNTVIRSNIQSNVLSKVEGCISKPL